MKGMVANFASLVERIMMDADTTLISTESVTIVCVQGNVLVTSVIDQ